MVLISRQIRVTRPFLRSRIIGFYALLLLSPCVAADASEWQPTAGHRQTPIWPGAVPDAEPLAGPENETGLNSGPVAGKPWTWVADVVHPTMTVYSPRGRNTGAALIVFPGGGYRLLAIDLEGTEVCDWATSRGITCILLKYRVPGLEPGVAHRSGPYPFAPAALEDAQRTLGLVRLHAAEWRIDPHKIGVIGFSAGGHLVAAISTHFDRRIYPAVDAADRESCRPNFAIAIYPGHLLLGVAQYDARQFGRELAIDTPKRRALAAIRLNPDIPVTERTPPTFLAHARDDPIDHVGNSLAYYRALYETGVSAEIHIFDRGGHAFGLRPTDHPITHWPRLVEDWLHSIGMLQ